MNNEEKLLFSWKAMERPYKKWSKDYYSTVIVLAFLVSIILFFIEGVMPVIVVWSVVFMLWATNRSQPREAEYHLTNWGLRTEKELYQFEGMRSFWFEDRWGEKLMRILVNKFPGQVVVVIPMESEEKIKKIMVGRIVMQAPEPNWSDKVIGWWNKKVPLD